jgi:hypothetical protein
MELMLHRFTERLLSIFSASWGTSVFSRARSDRCSELPFKKFFFLFQQIVFWLWQEFHTFKLSVLLVNVSRRRRNVFWNLVLIYGHTETLTPNLSTDKTLFLILLLLLLSLQQISSQFQAIFAHDWTFSINITSLPWGYIFLCLILLSDVSIVLPILFYCLFLKFSLFLFLVLVLALVKLLLYKVSVLAYYRPLTIGEHLNIVNSKGFWRWCVTLITTGFLDFELLVILFDIACG